MPKLYLYTAFHFNLAFSSIPKEQYASVIDNCYWPLVELLDTYPGIKLGFEFTGDTLEKIHQVDYTLIKKIAQFHEEGRCEIIGSGMSQAIFPLIPEEINQENLAWGNRIYQKYFKKIPSTAYVNEQTFSEGIARLYRQAGYQNLIMEFENSKLFNSFEKRDLYYAHKLQGLNLVWNSSVSFQKFQRYAMGSLKEDEYLDYLFSHLDQDEDRAFLFYGSDAEIFDYKPGNYDEKFKGYSGQEMKRIYKLFDTLATDGRVEFVTPSYVAQNFNSGAERTLGTAQYPILCKKQPKYNVVRWAVSGRENTKMNTECMKIYKKVSALKTLGNPVEEDYYRDISLLWGSDYRTKTTESKVNEFYYLLGKMQRDLEKKEQSVYRNYTIEHDFILANPNGRAWNTGTSYPFEVSFKSHDRFENGFQVEVEGERVHHQLEDIEYYRDGSIRRCKIILMLPSMEPGQVLQGRFINQKVEVQELKESNHMSVDTDTVKIAFSEVKKGTIEALAFPQISLNPVLGQIPHGYFDDIRYSFDYFSGHTIIRERNLKQITDLDHSDILMDQRNLPLRIPVRSKIKGAFGELWKIFYIYQYEPRVDIEYHFRFQDLYPVFFRTGILTFHPGFFDANHLGYRVANGGKEESYRLKGTTLDQPEPVSLDISASSCLGATKGWVDFHDHEKGVVVCHENHALYGVPMLTYKEMENGKYFLRIQHSISETDDTGSIFWKGHSKFKMSIYGYTQEGRDAAIANAENNQGGVILLQKEEG